MIHINNTAHAEIMMGMNTMDIYISSVYLFLNSLDLNVLNLVLFWSPQTFYFKILVWAWSNGRKKLTFFWNFPRTSADIFIKLQYVMNCILEDAGGNSYSLGHTHCKRSKVCKFFSFGHDPKCLHVGHLWGLQLVGHWVHCYYLQHRLK